MDPASFILGLVAGGFLVWVAYEVWEAPIGHQTEEGYGPISCIEAEAKAEARGYVRGKLETLRAIRSPRTAHTEPEDGRTVDLCEARDRRHIERAHNHKRGA